MSEAISIWCVLAVTIGGILLTISSTAFVRRITELISHSRNTGRHRLTTHNHRQPRRTTEEAMSTGQELELRKPKSKSDNFNPAVPRQAWQIKPSSMVLYLDEWHRAITVDIFKHDVIIGMLVEMKNPSDHRHTVGIIFDRNQRLQVRERKSE
jgi:hypothetical protein